MKIDGIEYIPRFIDSVIEQHLEAFGAVELTGCMWSGKTFSARAHGNSEISLDDKQAKRLAQIDVDAVLQGKAPHVIDEWQQVPEIWDCVRTKVDKAAGKRGLYILTGSSTPAKDKTHHSGSGRISRLKMWPMSLSETGQSKGTVSLSGLFNGEFESGSVETNLEDLTNYICEGGWPGAIGVKSSVSQLIPAQYLDALIAKQDKNAPGTEQELLLFLQSIARNIGSPVTLQTIAKDMGLAVDKRNYDSSTRTVRNFLNYFLNHYILCDITGWDAPIKSPSRLRTKPKHGFADPSLPAALLGVSPSSLMSNMQLFGQLFEELCLRDLRVFSSCLPAAGSTPLHYYRDSDGLEVDAIIQLRDGRWGAIEIKLGANKAEEGAKNLLRLKNKVAANPAARNPSPSFMLVLVGKTDFKYKTPEGVYVAPITELTI